MCTCLKPQHYADLKLFVSNSYALCSRRTICEFEIYIIKCIVVSCSTCTTNNASIIQVDSVE